jgi:WD40 repeat protein
MTELSPDGRWAVVRIGSDQIGRLQIFDVATGRSSVELPLHDPSGGERAAFSPNGRWLAYSDPRPETAIRIWDIETARERAAPAKAIWPWVFSPDGRRLAFAVREARHPPTQINLLDMASAEAGTSLPIPAGFTCYDLHFAPDGKTLLTICDSVARRGASKPEDILDCGWELATGKERFRMSRMGVMFFPAKASWFGIAEDRGTVRKFDYTTGQECGKFTLAREDRAEIWGTGIAPDGRYLAVEALVRNPFLLRLNAWWPRRPVEDFIAERLRLLDTNTGESAAVLPAKFDWNRRDGMERTRYSTDGSLLAVMTDAKIEIWDLPPRGSMTWLAAIAVGLALPIVGLAKWRSRRLQRAAA